MLEAFLCLEVWAFDHKGGTLGRRRRLINWLICKVGQLVLHELSVVEIGPRDTLVLLLLGLKLLRGHVELILHLGRLRKLLQVRVARALRNHLHVLLGVGWLTVRRVLNLVPGAAHNLR